jgi:hypothetical protein
VTHCGLEALGQEGRRQLRSQKATSTYYRATPGTATAQGLTPGREFGAARLTAHDLELYVDIAARGVGVGADLLVRLMR